LKGYTHLTKKEIDEIVQAYDKDLVRMQDLAKKYSRTRMGIYKVIKKSGVNIENRILKKRESLKRYCSNCKKIFYCSEYRVKCSKYIYCSQQCYYEHLDRRQSGKYVDSKKGRQIARKLVAKFYNLQKTDIVHHRDRNNLNNNIENLMVFRSHSEHLKFHRIGEESVEPLFDGKKISIH